MKHYETLTGNIRIIILMLSFIRNFFIRRRTKEERKLRTSQIISTDASTRKFEEHFHFNISKN